MCEPPSLKDKIQLAHWLVCQWHFCHFIWLKYIFCRTCSDLSHRFCHLIWLKYIFCRMCSDLSHRFCRALRINTIQKRYMFSVILSIFLCITTIPSLFFWKLNEYALRWLCWASLGPMLLLTALLCVGKKLSEVCSILREMLASAWCRNGPFPCPGCHANAFFVYGKVWQYCKSI